MCGMTHVITRLYLLPLIAAVKGRGIFNLCFKLHLCFYVCGRGTGVESRGQQEFTVLNSGCLVAGNFTYEQSCKSQGIDLPPSAYLLFPIFIDSV